MAPGGGRARSEWMRRVVTLAVIATVFAGCAAERDPKASASAIVGPTAAAATPTTRPKALVPQDVISIPDVTGAMMVAAGEGSVWTSGEQAAWRIDPDADDAYRVPVAIGSDGWTGMVIADGDLWALDFFGNRILRVDPVIGTTIATIEVAHPTS